ncbi:hypothetical protein Dvar_36560 [Desulfosarcina variabilis str. Montpellier]|uniref:hypothetical protein n=1 Tax=Desulfosarcina variabilis TaxID=2300 RepID=UPI003AFAB757
MQSLHVNYDDASGTIERIENAKPEPWETVCERFDNDVRRMRDVSDQTGYTALYTCYDENNNPVHYLVQEDETLLKLRRRTHLSKLGQPPS